MITIPEAIKDLIKSDSTRKNFRVHFPNGEHTDITNENIISESVSLTESLCSESQLKFGLGESPTLEFETVGIGKIKGFTIEAQIEIYCDDSVPGAVYMDDLGAYVYPIKYGTFVIDSCKKQADMSRRKIVAYNELATNDWNLPSKVVESLQGFYWYKEKTVRFAIEGLIKLLLPDYERNYTEVLPTVQLYDETETYTKTIGADTYTLDVAFGQYGIHYFAIDDNIESERITYAKASYLDAYKTAVDSIANELRNIGWLEMLDVESNINYTSVLNIRKNEGDGSSTHGNIYFVPEDKLQKVFYPIKLFGLDESELIIPNFEFKYYHPGTSSSDLYYEWQSITTSRRVRYYTDRPTPDTNYYLPVRMILRKNGAVVIDTGRHENVMMSDDDNNLAVSPSGAYLSTELNKQKVTLTKEDKNYTRTTVKMDLYQLNLNSILNLSMLDVIGAYYELKGQNLIFDRNNSTKAISLSDSETMQIGKELYESLWYDDDLSQEIARITCTFTSSETEKDFFLGMNKYETMPQDFRSYSLARNLIVDTNTYTQEEMEAILSGVLTQANFDSYMPSELECKGLPFVEVGDYIDIDTDEGTIKALVERRVLSGIQHLTDSITCKDEPSKPSSNDATYNSTTETLIIS